MNRQCCRVFPSFAKAELPKLHNKVKRRSTPAVCFEDGHHRDVSLSLAAPLLEQEGWTRPKENAAKHPLKGADGGAERASPIGRSNKEVVAHGNAVGMLSERLSVSDHPGAARHPSCTRRGARARTVFLIWTVVSRRTLRGFFFRSRPPLLREPSRRRGILRSTVDSSVTVHKYSDCGYRTIFHYTMVDKLHHPQIKSSIWP
jgi:hypothetical protein